MRGFYSHMRSFVRIKPARNGKITLLFIYIGKSCLSHKFFKSLICLLMIFPKMKSHENLQIYSLIQCSLFITHLIITWIWIKHGRVVAPKLITMELRCKIAPLENGSLLTLSIPMDARHSIIKGLYFTAIAHFACHN